MLVDWVTHLTSFLVTAIFVLLRKLLNLWLASAHENLISVVLRAKVGHLVFFFVIIVVFLLIHLLLSLKLLLLLLRVLLLKELLFGHKSLLVLLELCLVLGLLAR